MVQVHVGPLLRLCPPANVSCGAAHQIVKVLVTDSIGKMPPDSPKVARAREPVRSLINWILGFWALVSAAIAIWFLSINSSAGDWQDVVTVIGLVFIAACGLAIGLTWLIIRYLVTGDTARAAVATLVPPALIGLVPFILWLL